MRCFPFSNDWSRAERQTTALTFAFDFATVGAATDTPFIVVRCEQNSLCEITMSSTNNNSTPVENVAPQSPEQNKETQKLADPKATPAIVRARQQRREFLVSSPSDSLLSPCTKKLVGRTARTQVSHPINILRAKQQMGIPKMADLNDQGSASEEQQK
ncbi:hypothetical protein QR680_002619 [Steinernema hermaphroditum]|uniref:Uncharacterized protein n=1 Tax=Steinernema hermaphroditum TaxID=289476 RepID=A0AA39LIP4_9BILA|nr:hypothetical protein QR680_002619 [Steinernema hermaphroditum]